MIEKVSLVTCVSRYTRRRFLRWSNLNPANVKVLPNTISNRKVIPGKQSIKDKLGLNHKKIIVTVGRLSASEQYKGQDRILTCLPELISKQPDIHYLIAGDGDDKPRLQKLAKDLGIKDNVTFLGNIENEKLDQLYQAADLFAMPSTGEGFGIVFLEAMSHGTHALGLNEDGSSDPLQDGKLGIVATKETLCEEILKALNTSLDKTLAEKVQKTFGKQNFNQHVNELLSMLS